MMQEESNTEMLLAQNERKCPMHGHSSPLAKVAGPRLMRVSEVQRECEPSAPLACVLDWVQNFLAVSHPELGRKGPVCPFVPISLEIDTIWMAEIAATNPSVEAISQIITAYRDLFLATEPKSGPEMMNKAFLVVFPHLQGDGAQVVDEVQYKLKKFFVAKGLMLGEFHASNQSPGLRNPLFRPLRSPIPMLAIRYMVDSDLPFLLRSDYPAEERAAFLRAYLTRLAGELSPAKFSEALEAMVEAEVEKRMNEMTDGKPDAHHSAWHCAHCGTENHLAGVPA